MMSFTDEWVCLTFDTNVLCCAFILKTPCYRCMVSVLPPTPAGQKSSPSSLLLVLKRSLLRSLHLVKTPHALYSSWNPTNGRVLTSVSNVKSILSCSNTQLWIDNWKVKQRRLIFDRVVVLKTAAPPWDGGPRLHVVDVRNPGESKLQPGSRELPSLPPSFRACIPPSLGWVLMPTWGTGG